VNTVHIELANGVRLEAEQDGPAQGTPLVLITGLGLQLTAWPASFMRGLHDRGFRTLRFDNRDAGLSSRVRSARALDIRTEAMRSMIGLNVRAPYTLRDMAGDVVGLMDALSLSDAHVVGVSMGGMIGQVLAASAPQRVRSLVSIMSSSGATRFRFHFTPATRAVLTPPPRRADEERLLDHYAHIWSLISSPGMQPPPDQLRERLRADMRRWCPWPPAKTPRAIFPVHASKRLQAWAMTCPSRWCRDWYRRLPGTAHPPQRCARRRVRLRPRLDLPSRCAY